MSSNIESVIPLTPVIRKKASRTIWARKEELFDMNYLYESLNQIVESYEQEDEKQASIPLFQRLRQVDLTPFFNVSPGLNRFFPCTFFDKRFAWISKNTAGEYRYFSKFKDGHGFYAFDLFDILTIVLNMTSKEVVRHLETSYPFRSMTEWTQGEKIKYRENRSMLHHNRLAETPNLQRLLRGGVEVLETFLSYGEEKIGGKHLSDGRHSVFFLSVQYFKDTFFPSKSVSTLNQWVNLFAVLGLIEKTVNVPVELQIEAEKQQTLRKRHNHVSFYIVPSFKKILRVAEGRAKELVSHRISYHQLTKDVVMSIFGHAVHDHVYVQKTYGRKKSVKKKSEKISVEWLETFFRLQLNEHKLVSKKEFEESAAISKKALHQLWNNLVARHECELDVPSKEERLRFGLNARQTIARERNSASVVSTVWKDEHSLPWDVWDDIPVVS